MIVLCLKRDCLECKGVNDANNKVACCVCRIVRPLLLNYSMEVVAYFNTYHLSNFPLNVAGACELSKNWGKVKEM